MLHIMKNVAMELAVRLWEAKWLCEIFVVIDLCRNCVSLDGQSPKQACYPVCLVEKLVIRLRTCLMLVKHYQECQGVKISMNV